MNWHELFSYSPDSGDLVWAVDRPGRTRVLGSQVGTVNTRGCYRTFQFKQKRFYCHRVIWEMVNGPIPDGLCIDHIDGNGLNNRLANLRLVTLSDNQRNRRLVRTNKLGIGGVYRHRGGFSVCCAGYIGWTKDFFEACCMRRSAQLSKGYHPNHERPAS